MLSRCQHTFARLAAGAARVILCYSLYATPVGWYYCHLAYLIAHRRSEIKTSYIAEGEFVILEALTSLLLRSQFDGYCQLFTDVSGQSIGPIFKNTFPRSAIDPRRDDTSHLLILVINQPDAQNLFYNKFISCLYMFRAPCTHHQEVKIVLYSLWYHHTYWWPSGAQIIQPLVTYRCDDTRGCIIQFWPPDDEHMVLETCRGMK